MYLRTTRRKNKDGSVATYYHLAHNYSDSESKQSVVRVIHNFGRADELDREHLVRLCQSIARICGLQVTDPVQTSEMARTENLAELKSLPDTLQLVRTMELGTLVVIEALWEQLGIGKSLREITEKANSEAASRHCLRRGTTLALRGWGIKPHP